MKRANLTIASSTNMYVFDVDVVESKIDQEKGLMLVEEITDNYGMLFIENRKKAKRMWMKNTFVSLDIVFINEKFEIHKIFHSAKPLSEFKIWSDGLVVAVIELKGGICSKLGISIGDKIDVNYIFGG